MHDSERIGFCPRKNESKRVLLCGRHFVPTSDDLVHHIGNMRRSLVVVVSSQCLTSQQPHRLQSTGNSLLTTISKRYAGTRIKTSHSNLSSPPPSTVSELPPVPPNCHRLIMMRHGESEFNNANVFTGWCDVALSQRGIVEAVEAGQVLLSHHLHFRKCYVSLLTRSIVTAHRSLEAAGVAYTPIEYDWRWNERHYGALQGLSKERTAVRLGRERVMKWRRSYDAQPPLMTPQHPHYNAINEDPRYRHLSSIPRGESLQDCQRRVLQAWEDLLVDICSVQEDDFKYSMLVAHANTLRALVMHLDGIPKEKIEDLNIPTAVPFYYDIDKATGQIVKHQPRAELFNGTYITDERKQRSFLERRRAANDPRLWALYDHQVATSQLLGQGEGLSSLDEATYNTKLFSPSQQTSGPE